jgi:hypothetical protein
MNPIPGDQPPETTPTTPAVELDPQEAELQRQVLAHVREFGPRKYQTFYTKAKQLKESGLDPKSVRQSLILELPAPVNAPEGGVHFISMVHAAKQKAIYHVVRNAVEDALARRPAQFREEHATAPATP